MNPITLTKNQNLMNKRELSLGYTGKVSSWHQQYKDSAWIFIGGLKFELTEGDIICVFSQYGEVANLNLVRDRETGKSKGFAFLCYENQKSTILATDNLNGITIAGRVIRVDHVENYKVPGSGRVGCKEKPSNPVPGAEIVDFVREHGCAPEAMKKLRKLEKTTTMKQYSPRRETCYRNRSRSRSPHYSRSSCRRDKNSPEHSPPRPVRYHANNRRHTEMQISHPSLQS